MPNPVVRFEEIVIFNLLAFISLWTYYKACTVEAGRINQ